MLPISGRAVAFELTAAVAPLKAPAVAVMRMQILTAMRVVFMARRRWRRKDVL